MLYIYSQLHFPNNDAKLTDRQWSTLPGLKHELINGQHCAGVVNGIDCGSGSSSSTSNNSIDNGGTCLSTTLDEQVWISFKVIDRSRCCSSTTSGEDVTQSKIIFNITIGQSFSCDCGGHNTGNGASSAKDSVFCSHINFILTKVLKISPSSNLFLHKQLNPMQVWALMLLHDSVACEQYHHSGAVPNRDGVEDERGVRSSAVVDSAGVRSQNANVEDEDDGEENGDVVLEGEPICMREVVDISDDEFTVTEVVTISDDDEDDTEQLVAEEEAETCAVCFEDIADSTAQNINQR